MVESLRFIYSNASHLNRQQNEYLLFKHITFFAMQICKKTDRHFMNHHSPDLVAWSRFPLTFTLIRILDELNCNWIYALNVLIWNAQILTLSYISIIGIWLTNESPRNTFIFQWTQQTNYQTYRKIKHICFVGRQSIHFE